jgi:methyl-accepting chemotaxis protein
LVGVTLFGLCIAGALAGYLMQREMLAARIDQAHAIVDMARNMAAGLRKEVEAGTLTKEAALAEFGRRANAMTYDNGAGYLFGTSYDGITVLAPDPKQVGTNRMEVVTNGRKLSHELMDGVKANGEILLTYEYVKPGEEKPIRKIGYAVNVPGFDMYLGTGAYLDDLDAKLKPIVWLLGFAILGIGIISGSIAGMISRSISIPLGQLGARMKALADGELEGDIPGIGRGDEVGARWPPPSRSSRTTHCGFAGWKRPRRRPRSGPRRSAARPWKASPMISNAVSTASSVRYRRLRPGCRPPRNR